MSGFEFLLIIGLGNRILNIQRCKVSAITCLAIGLLNACASHTGVIPISNDTFMIAKQQATGFPGLGNLRAEIIREGEIFCSARGESFELTNVEETQPPYILGNYPRSEINFKCSKVVAANSELSPPKMSSGTAFAVKNVNTLVTAYHVVDGADTLNVVCHSGGSGQASIIKIDPSNDIALLKIDFPTKSFLSVDDIELKVGQKVFTLGYPVPEILGANVKYSEGVVSSLSGLRGAASLLQITTPIQPGNSGGPLLNEHGNLVGIVTSTAAVTSFMRYTGTLPQSVNWSVKSGYIKPLLSDITSIPQKHFDDPIEHAQESLCMVTTR
jgi:S1-C subfamily serine protease